MTNNEESAVEKPSWRRRLRQGTATSLLLLGATALLGGFLGIAFVGPSMLWAYSLFAGLGGVGLIIAGNCIEPAPRSAPARIPEEQAAGTTLGGAAATTFNTAAHPATPDAVAKTQPQLSPKLKLNL